MDALALYLFGDGPEGREQVREIDRTIAEIPGLEGLTLLEDYLDGALRRAAERPAGPGSGAMPGPAAASTNGDGPRPRPLGRGRSCSRRLSARRRGRGARACSSACASTSSLALDPAVAHQHAPLTTVVSTTEPEAA